MHVTCFDKWSRKSVLKRHAEVGFVSIVWGLTIALRVSAPMVNAVLVGGNIIHCYTGTIM